MRASKAHSTIHTLLFWGVLVMVFLLGGSLQIFGLITNTVLTVSIILLIMVTIIISSIYNGKLRYAKWYLWATASAAILIVSASYAQKDLLYSVASVLNVLTPWAILIFVLITIRKLDSRQIFRYFLFISALQLPVIFLQRISYEHISQIATQRVEYIDIGFGTFFLKADHSLGFFLLCMVVYVLFSPSSKMSGIERCSWLVLWTLTIFSINSKISHLLFLVVISFFLFSKLIGISGVKYLMLFLAVVIITILPLQFQIMDPLHQLDLQYSSLKDHDTIPRWGPLIIFLYEPVSWIGNGPFSYYDPISKQWGLMGGHSQWYSLYYDYGLLGFLVLGSLVVFTAISAHHRSKGEPVFIYCALVIAYGLVTQFLNDLAILLAYFLFLFINWGQKAKMRETNNQLFRIRYSAPSLTGY